MLLSLPRVRAFEANSFNILYLIIGLGFNLSVSVGQSQVRSSVNSVASLLINLTFVNSWTSVAHSEESVVSISYILVGSVRVFKLIIQLSFISNKQGGITLISLCES